VCDIEVSALASVVVTSPGTSCAHYMQFRVAKVDQKFSVHDDSLLRKVFYYGISRFSLFMKFENYMHAVTGLIIFLCGSAIQFLGA